MNTVSETPHLLRTKLRQYHTRHTREVAKKIVPRDEALRTVSLENGVLRSILPYNPLQRKEACCEDREVPLHYRYTSAFVVVPDVPPISGWIVLFPAKVVRRVVSAYEEIFINFFVVENPLNYDVNHACLRFHHTHIGEKRMFRSVNKLVRL